ncbi:DEAD-box ATP-dependent RNA helicase 31 [Spatholobus suberectus]|nr:DEAD-box ATP-dependent RNA helicase 31 [Spatholobus suberectus]
MPTTALLSQLRLLHPLLPMKPRTLPLLSRTFFFPSSKFLRNAPFRAFSARAYGREKLLRARPSKSLVDDEADLSDWVDELRTGQPDRLGQRFSRGDDDGGGEEREFRPRRNDRASALGKRRGGDLRRGRDSGNWRRKFQPRSNDDDDGNVDVDVAGRKSKVGGIGEFLTEDEDEDEESEGSEEEEILNKSRTALFGQQNGLNRRTTEPTPRPSTGGSDSYLSDTRFDQCSVSLLSLKGIKDAGYEKMTVVQEATLPVILKGKDVLAKAKTGTGKTVAFLLPSIEVVAKSPPSDRDQRRPPILVLVICPTRELASQAAAEATKLLKYHPTIGVQVVIGGTRLALEQKRMQANPCQILVATPGRLRDHIENTAGFATRLMGVKVLVLDEADHLLDMGFRKDIEKIIAAVPKQRQSLMFSATIPEEVRQVCHIALRRDHEFINTVQEGTEETHSQVHQTHLVSPLDKHFSLLYVLLKDHIADDVDYKVLVFCTTAMVTRLVAELLGELNLNVREIHSRKPQSYRTRVSEEFRKSKGLILVTSDVSARGVDYPDVTLVVQVGLPADREQYIHRLGRTGRRGKEGQGILLLAPWEDFFLHTVKDLPIEKAAVPSVDPDTKKKVEKALSHVEMKNKEVAYQAWLGYYNSNKKVGRDKYRLVELANEFSRSMGLDNPPAIPKLVLGKMGLRNIPGLRAK